MRRMLTLFSAARGTEHRAVFGAFARGLARVIGTRTVRARIRAVEV